MFHYAVLYGQAICLFVFSRTSCLEEFLMKSVQGGDQLYSGSIMCTSASAGVLFFYCLARFGVRGFLFPADFVCQAFSVSYLSLIDSAQGAVTVNH